MASAESPAAQIAQALVDCSLTGAFPEDKVSSLAVDADSLPTAIKALADARAKLQVRDDTPIGFGACILSSVARRQRYTQSTRRRPTT